MLKLTAPSQRQDKQNSQRNLDSAELFILAETSVKKGAPKIANPQGQSAAAALAFFQVKINHQDPRDGIQEQASG
jgi:hypothetical protein